MRSTAVFVAVLVLALLIVGAPALLGAYLLRWPSATTWDANAPAVPPPCACPRAEAP